MHRLWIMKWNKTQIQKEVFCCKLHLTYLSIVKESIRFNGSWCIKRHFSTRHSRILMKIGMMKVLRRPENRHLIFLKPLIDAQKSYRVANFSFLNKSIVWLRTLTKLIFIKIREGRVGSYYIIIGIHHKKKFRFSLLSALSSVYLNLKSGKLSSAPYKWQKIFCITINSILIEWPGKNWLGQFFWKKN
jgi:hypothetical protein